MKPHFRVRAIPFAFLSLAWFPAQSSASRHVKDSQPSELGVVPILEYSNGTILAQYVPYGRRWGIKGSLPSHLQGNDSTLVTAEIFNTRTSHKGSRISAAFRDVRTSGEYRAILLALTRESSVLSSPSEIAALDLALRAGEPPPRIVLDTLYARCLRLDAASTGGTAVQCELLSSNNRFLRDHRNWESKLMKDGSNGCWESGGTQKDTFRVFLGGIGQGGQIVGNAYTVRLRFYGKALKDSEAETVAQRAISAADSAYVPGAPPNDDTYARFQRLLPEIFDSGEVSVFDQPARGVCNQRDIMSVLYPLLIRYLSAQTTLAQTRTFFDTAFSGVEGRRADGLRQRVANAAQPVNQEPVGAAEFRIAEGSRLVTARPEAAGLPVRGLVSLGAAYTSATLSWNPDVVAADAVVDVMDETAEAITKLIAEIAGIELSLKGAMVQTEVVAVEAVPWNNAQAETDRIRVGTAFSVGGAALSLGQSPKLEGLRMLTAKYYWKPVDKSLPDPYRAGRGSHMSWVLGIVWEGKVSYQGAEQGTIGGLVPAVGVGYDLNEYFTLQGGMILFRGATPLPGAPGQGLRMAPFLTFGFDFDAANRLKTLLGG